MAVHEGKGLCHPRRMRTLKSLAQLFQISSDSSGSCFHLFEIAFIFGKLAEFFIYKRSLVITETVCCDIFESFAMAERRKSRDELYGN